MKSLTSVLLRSKFSPPSLPQGCIPRTRLCQLLAQPDAFRVITLTAPAGYGKTTLALELVQHNFQTHQLLWTHLDEADNDAGRLCRYLVASCVQQGIEVDAELQRVVQCGAALSPWAVLQQLQCDLQQRQQPLLWIFDDFHCLTEPDILRAFNEWIKTLPAHVTLLFVSRTTPALSLAKLTLQGHCIALEQQHLAFDCDEVAHYLGEGSDSVVDAQQLWQMTEGWITGLQLWRLMQSNITNPQAQIHYQLLHSSELLQQYWSEEVFDVLPDDLQQCLLATCVVSEFNTDMAEQLCQDQQAAVWIQQILCRGLFLQQQGEQGWYAYHDLFRQFLLHRLQNNNPELYRQLQQRAFEAWQALNAIDKAFEHLPSIQDASLSIQALQQYGWEFHQRGNYRILAAVFDGLAEQDILTSVPVTFLYAMSVQLYSRDTRHNRYLLQHAAELWPTSLTEPELPEAMAGLKGFEMDRANWYVQIERAQQCVDAILQMGQGHATGLLEKRLNVQAWIAWHQGQIDQARQLIQAAYQGAADVDSFQGMFYFKHVEAVIAWGLGDLTQAFQLQNEALSIRQQCYLNHVATLDLLYRYRVDIVWEWHQLQWGHQLLQRILPQMEQADEKWRLPLQAVALRLQLQRQDWVAAQQLYQYLTQKLTLEGLTPDTQLELLQSVLYFALESGHPDKVVYWLTHQAAHYATESVWLHLRYQWLCSVAHTALGEFAKAQPLLQLTLQQSQTLGFCKEAALAQLWLQMTSFAQTQCYDESMLNTCLQRIAQQQWIGSCMIGKQLLQPLLQHALKQGCLEPVAALFAERLLYLFKQRPIELHDPDYPEYIQTIPLSRKEWLVLQRIGEGYSNEQISEMQFVELSTVKSHIKSLYRKLGLRNRQEARLKYAEISEWIAGQGDGVV